MAEKMNIIAMTAFNLIMLQLIAASFTFVNAANNGTNLYNLTEANSTFQVVEASSANPFRDFVNRTQLNSSDTTTTEAENSDAIDDIWDRYTGAVKVIRKYSGIMTFFMDAFTPAIAMSVYFITPVKSGFLRAFIWTFIIAYQIVYFASWARLVGGKNRI